MRIGQKCAGCHRVMRPAGTLLAEWPGTIAHHSRGVCYPCRRAQKRGRALGPSKASRPECCGRCGRRMRQRDTRSVDHPGTVQHGARELCASCYTADRAGRQVAAVPRDGGVKPCRGCDRPTRPTVRRLGDFPGTVPRVRDGFCQRCLNHEVDVPILAMAERVALWRAGVAS